MTDRRRWTAANGDLLTCEGLRVRTDWLGRRAETVRRYERWRDGTLLESQIDVMAHRYWGLDEFRLALLHTGFDDVEVTARYRRGRAPRGSDAGWTFKARRR